MPLDGYEKAAIFLSCVGEEAAAEALKGLDAKERGKITMHMTRLKTVNRSTIDDVMEEASDMISSMISRGDIHIGGEEFVKNVLSKGLGEDGEIKIPTMASKEGPLDSLKRVDSRNLSNFLLAEHPQTIAVIICLLEPAQAAEVLSSLPDKLKADVSVRIAEMKRISESAIEEINEVLKGQLDIGKVKSKEISGTKTIAEILDRCDRTTEQMVIKSIEEQNDELANSIREFIFAFNDLVRIDDRGIRMILNEISTEELTLALKTASEELKEKIFDNMSQRAAQILKEEMSAKGPVRVSEVEKAQHNIAKVAKMLEGEGKIFRSGRGDEEFVV